MKKASTWAAIFGGIYVFVHGYVLAEVLTHPITLYWVNIALIVSNLAGLIFGVYLVYLFITLRQKDDHGVVIKPQPNSPEDIEHLAVKRNWIIAFFLVFLLLGSIESWFINNYSNGFTIIDVALVFDILFNICFLYIVINLLRGRVKVLNTLFYLSIVYTIGWIVFSAVREYWAAMLAILIAGVYIVYSIKAPTNRKNFRIANFVILPLFMILATVSPFFDKKAISDLTRKESFAIDQFLEDSNKINSAYQIFLQRATPGRKELVEIRNAIEKRDLKINEIVSLDNQLLAAYEKEIPNLELVKMKEDIRYNLIYMDLHRAQANKTLELVDFAEKIDFDALTNEQVDTLITLGDEISAYNAKFLEIDFEQDLTNLYRF